jgi:hypothetical protein
MTGLVGFFLAIVAGWLIPTKRRMAVAMLLPFLAILAVQTIGIGLGKGVSPPSTVTAFPGLIGYYVVQLIIFGLAFAAGNLIRIRRHRDPTSALDLARPTRIALAINTALCALTVVGFVLDRSFIDPGSVATHTANGSPPIAGVAGILLSIAAVVVLGAMSLVGRRRTRAAAAS